MAKEATAYGPGPRPRTVTAPSGQVIPVPANWELLPPGDATLTRRVKAAGEYWLVQKRRGRRVFSQGIWADRCTIESIKTELDAERSTDAYQKKRKADVKRREKKQQVYVGTFKESVVQFLDFHPDHAQLAEQIGELVATHATPVGSGTVARTERIPIEKRAEAAVIAWMRHQTTAYDNMKIPRVRGKRREVRQLLAERSRNLLDQYRRGERPSTHCPLLRALAKENKQPERQDG